MAVPVFSASLGSGAARRAAPKQSSALTEDIDSIDNIIHCDTPTTATEELSPNSHGDDGPQSQVDYLLAGAEEGI